MYTQPRLDEHGDLWVTHGRIKFINYTTRYRPDTELVLSNITFEVKPREKIGVIGRTRAGKSTLCLALCRILEAESGKIEIDGVDISQVGIGNLRNNITVIPQDPTIFENTLRFNLNPDETATDAEIIRLLDDAWLSNLVLRDVKGLDANIRGSDLSSGEKQLIWICRAVLRVSL